MRKESQTRENFFFLATGSLAIHLRQPYRIQEELIETENFVPEAFVIHHLQMKDARFGCSNGMQLSQGEMWMSEIDVKETGMGTLAASSERPWLSGSELELAGNGDDDGEDWDDDEEDWDDDDEEEWDEDEEDWDDEDEEDWDEDEEEDEDWEEEKE